MRIDETANNDNYFGRSDVAVNCCLVATRFGDVGPILITDQSHMKNLIPNEKKFATPGTLHQIIDCKKCDTFT